MTEWRTDFENIPVADGGHTSVEFDVVVRDHEGNQWRVTDCIRNASRQICSYDPDWGYEPIEYAYTNGEFRRVTHWRAVELPPLEDKGRPD